LIYIVVLFIEVLLFVFFLITVRHLPELLLMLIAYAFGANLCFSNGFVLNNYAWCLGQRSEWVDRATFASGTILAKCISPYKSREPFQKAGFNVQRLKIL